jgi:ribonuclease BN (tRNA processing enzyme)
VPAVGFQIDSGDASLVYSGDTTTNDALWSAVNQIENLRYLIIETAFCNREMDLAIASKHLCPNLLVGELQKLQKHIEIFITHLKPGEVEATMREIHDCAGRWNPRMLETNMIFQL